MPRAFARIDLKGLNRLRREFQAGFSGGAGPIGQMLENWGLIYLKACQTEFRRKSAGGAGWAPLSPVTLQKTRKLRRLGILRLNSDVYFALFRGEAGNVFRRTPKGILVGVGGPGRHSFYKTDSPNKKPITVAAVAMIHHNGWGVPRRPILLEPNAVIAAEMRKETLKQVTTITRRAS